MTDYKVELAHPDLTGYKLFVDEELVSEGACDSTLTIDVPVSKHTVSLWIEPWKIVPKVRINNILVNFALADIHLYDHKLDVVLDKDFFEAYHKRDIDYRIKGLFGEKKPDSSVYDAVIGVGNRHQSVVDEIKQALDIE